MDQEIQIDPKLWVDEYGDYLYRYAYSRLWDANAAEETVQETFMAGIRYQSQFSGRGASKWPGVRFVKLRQLSTHPLGYQFALRRQRRGGAFTKLA